MLKALIFQYFVYYMTTCQTEKKRIKNENLYSTWTEIVYGVTILRPLLFNIFLAYLFFIISNIGIASYADNNMPCIAADSINGLITGKSVHCLIPMV